jgi:hypothetical protein
MRLALSLMMYCACMAIGALLVADQFHPILPAITAFLQRDAGRLAASGISVVLLLSPLAICLRWLQVMRRAREISYQTENGRISVSLLAIEEALTRALEGEPEVKKAHVRVREDRIKRTVVIEAVMSLWEVPNVTDRNRFCHRLLRRRFAELMPEQTAVQVILSLTRLHVRRPVTTVPTPLATPIDPALKPSTDTVTKREPDSYRDPLLDAALLPVSSNDEQLYVGPSYPVVKEDDDEVAQFFVRPATERIKGSAKKPST